MLKKGLLCFITSVVFFFSNSFSYNENDFKKAKEGNFWSITYLNLNYADLSYADLSCKSLSHFYLRNAKLYNANLRRVSLYSSYLEEADLSETCLEYARLEGARLAGINLTGTKVLGADFKNTTGLTNAQKKYLKENGAINVPPDINENIQQDLEPGCLILLIQKIFNVSKKQSLNLYHWLRKKDLTDKNLENQNLTKHHLIGAILRRANLKNADLSNQKLRGIILEDAIVEGTNFAHVKDLTNEQKQFLRGHGALNVPVEIIYELDN